MVGKLQPFSPSTFHFPFDFRVPHGLGSLCCCCAVAAAVGVATVGVAAATVAAATCRRRNEIPV